MQYNRFDMVIFITGKAGLNLHGNFKTDECVYQEEKTLIKSNYVLSFLRFQQCSEVISTWVIYAHRELHRPK